MVFRGDARWLGMSRAARVGTAGQQGSGGQQGGGDVVAGFTQAGTVYALVAAAAHEGGEAAAA
jgi:hypothetical protein